MICSTNKSPGWQELTGGINPTLGWPTGHITGPQNGPKAITVFIRLENVEGDVGQMELNIIHLDDVGLR